MRALQKRCVLPLVLSLVPVWAGVAAAQDWPARPVRLMSPYPPGGVAGHVPILFNTITNTGAQARNGKLRVLALASPTRSPVDKSTPVISESAGFEGYDADIWFGILAPAGTPQPVIARLHAAVAAAMQSDDVRAKLAAQLFNVSVTGPDEFGAMIKKDLARWITLVKDAKIKTE